MNNDDDYIIKTNINRSIAKELGLNANSYDENSSYEPPKEHGLSNSNVIIPSYYKLDKNPSKIFSIDYYEIIKDDIRNFRPLNKYQLEYIKKLSHEQKNELFDIYNLCTEVFNNSIQD
jgi:hypothetical protein